MKLLKQASKRQSIEKYLVCKDELKLYYGERLSGFRLEYTQYGCLDKPVVLVLGGISSNQYLTDHNDGNGTIAGWWSQIVGDDLAIDTKDYCVIGFNYLAQSQQQAVRHISTYDQALLINELLIELGVSQLFALIGCSYGGMVGLAFAERYPNKLAKLLCICCADKSTNKSIGLRTVQRRILQLGIEVNRSQESLSIARSLAMLGYRGEQEIDERFDDKAKLKNDELVFDVAEYLQYNGNKYSKNNSIERYLSLSLSIDLHRTNPKKISCPCSFIAVDSDQLVPIQQIELLVNSVKGPAQLRVLSSASGHDAFLTESKKVSDLIRPFLRNSNEY